MSRFPGIKLSGAEMTVMNIGAVDVDPELAKNVWAVGKLLTRETFTTRVFKSVLQRLWGESHYVDIREVSQNLFLFKFASPKERNFAVRGGPWIFDRHIVVLENFCANDIPSQVPLLRAPFWVQVEGLGVWMRKDKVAASLGQAFGGLIAWDKSDASRYGDQFRIRVWVKVNEPLPRGQMMMTEGGKPFEVLFRYEKMGCFCFRCGLMDHDIRTCDIAPPADENHHNRPYGLWLKAREDNHNGARFRPGNARGHNGGSVSSSTSRESRGKARASAEDHQPGLEETGLGFDIDTELLKFAEEEARQQREVTATDSLSGEKHNAGDKTVAKEQA